jgi:hypothetical protein
MGFWDQAAEARTKIRSPSHTVTFKFLEYIWCLLSRFSPVAGFSFDPARAVVNQIQNFDVNQSADDLAISFKIPE